MKNLPVIFANLSHEDYRRFKQATISYSGETGAGATFESHGKLAPYIASDESEIPRAAMAMGWKKFSVEDSGGEWIVRCQERELRENNIEIYIAISEEQLALAKHDKVGIPENDHIEIALGNLTEAVKVLARHAGIAKG